MIEGVGVGRIVHYVDTDGDCVAAIITHNFRRDDGLVNLRAFYDKSDAPAWVTSIPYSMESQTGSWHWPERV